MVKNYPTPLQKKLNFTKYNEAVDFDFIREQIFSKKLLFNDALIGNF